MSPQLFQGLVTVWFLFNCFSHEKIIYQTVLWVFGKEKCKDISTMFKGVEASRQFRWFTTAKIGIQFLKCFVLFWELIFNK